MENKNQEPFDYQTARQKLKEQFLTGKSLNGKGGAFAPLLQDRLIDLHSLGTSQQDISAHIKSLMIPISQLLHGALLHIR